MDKSILNKATSADEVPTSGYMFEDIAKASLGSSAACQDLEYYLSTKLSRSDANVKLKCLRLIKHVSEQNIEFRRLFQKKSDLIRGHLQFTAPPDPLKGDALPRAIREEAELALKAVFSTESSQSSSIAHRMQSMSSGPIMPPTSQNNGFFGNMNISIPLGGQRQLNIGAAGIKTVAPPSPPKTHTGHYGHSFPSSNTGPTTIYSSGNAYMPPDNFNRNLPKIEANPDGTFERKIVDEFTIVAGARVAPTSEALGQFAKDCLSFNRSLLSNLLVEKLNDDNQTWQVKLRCLSAIEFLIQREQQGLFMSSSSSTEKFADTMKTIIETILHKLTCHASLFTKARSIASLLSIPIASVPPSVSHQSRAPPLPNKSAGLLDLLDDPTPPPSLAAGSGSDLLGVSDCAPIVSAVAAPQLNVSPPTANPFVMQAHAPPVVPVVTQPVGVSSISELDSLFGHKSSQVSLTATAATTVPINSNNSNNNKTGNNDSGIFEGMQLLVNNASQPPPTVTQTTPPVVPASSPPASSNMFNGMVTTSPPLAAPIASPIVATTSASIFDGMTASSIATPAVSAPDMMNPFSMPGTSPQHQQLILLQQQQQHQMMLLQAAQAQAQASASSNPFATPSPNLQQQQLAMMLLMQQQQLQQQLQQLQQQQPIMGMYNNNSNFGMNQMGITSSPLGGQMVQGMPSSNHSVSSAPLEANNLGNNGSTTHKPTSSAKQNSDFSNLVNLLDM